MQLSASGTADRRLGEISLPQATQIPYDPASRRLRASSRAAARSRYLESSAILSSPSSTATIASTSSESGVTPMTEAEGLPRIGLDFDSQPSGALDVEILMGDEGSDVKRDLAHTWVLSRALLLA